MSSWLDYEKFRVNDKKNIEYPKNTYKDPWVKLVGQITEGKPVAVAPLVQMKPILTAKHTAPTPVQTATFHASMSSLLSLDDPEQAERDFEEEVAARRAPGRRPGAGETLDTVENKIIGAEAVLRELEGKAADLAGKPGAAKARKKANAKVRKQAVTLSALRERKAIVEEEHMLRQTVKAERTGATKAAAAAAKKAASAAKKAATVAASAPKAAAREELVAAHIGGGGSAAAAAPAVGGGAHSSESAPPEEEWETVGMKGDLKPEQAKEVIEELEKIHGAGDLPYHAEKLKKIMTDKEKEFTRTRLKEIIKELGIPVPPKDTKTQTSRYEMIDAIIDFIKK